VEVLIENRRLHEAAGDRRVREARYGKAAAKRIALRLQQLAGAETLEDMRHLPGRCHELTADRAGCLALDLVQPYRLIIKPTQQPPPQLGSGGLDWGAVDSVTVLDIIDYH
jgi:plasmid maintenance system killer protein